MEQEIKNGTYTIPEGFTAKIEDGKIIVEKKESGDEKIRKEIIDYFSQFKEDGIRGVDITSWIAYLEKQKDAEIEIEKAYKNADKIQYEKGFEDGVASVKQKEQKEQKEQKPVPKFSVGDYVKDTNYHGEPLYQIVYIDKECYICEYRGDKNMGDKAVMHFAFDNPYLRLEQKPAEGITHAEIEQAMDEVTKFKMFAADMAKRFNITHSRDIDWHNFCAGLLTYLKVNQPAEWSEEEKGILLECISALQNSSHWLLADKLSSLRPQPKQEWSEEDETCLEYALWCVMKTRHFVAKDACDLDACRCAERWLESLPGRFNLQSKQEWSKEDKKMLDDITVFVSGYADKRVVSDWVAFLKSLRPQPHLKPSEEQLKALRYVAYHLMPDENYRNEMFSLYYDLKDL